jgi:MFS family permease
MPKIGSNGKIVNRRNIAAIVLLFNTFSWFYLCQLTISKLECNMIPYLISIVISLIAGMLFLKKTNRLQTLKAWVIFGVLMSLLTIILVKYLPEWSIIFTSLLGVSFGIAMPFCLDLLIKLSIVENRGKIGGIVLFATFSTVFILYRIISALDFMFTGILLTLWRFWGFPLIFLIPEEIIQENTYPQKTQKFSLRIKDRTFCLYFAAWLMFSFVDSFQTIIMNIKAEELAFFMKIIEPCVAGFSAIIVGAISDVVGRRRILIFGFAFLGTAYAALCLLSHSLITWLLYSIIDGVAIGSASVLFIVVIWGEMTTGDSVDFYAIGETPFFITGALSLLFKQYLTSISQSSSFSLASFFLFTAVILLLFAPETLPEKVLKERELRSYIERAKKVREKFVR